MALVLSLTSSSATDSLQHSPISTNPSTPFNPSELDLYKLSQNAISTTPVLRARNICCVGAGYVGMYDLSSIEVVGYVYMGLDKSFAQLAFWDSWSHTLAK
jgi:hypothetical protein